MKKKAKNIGINIFLISVILMLLLTFHAVFIAGPLRAMEHEDNQIVQEYVRSRKLNNTEYLNRFSLDKTYYLIKDGANITFFDTYYRTTGTQEYVALDKVYDKAESLGFTKKQVSYGVYNEAVVFNLEKKGHIVFIDMNTMEVILDFGGANNVVE